MSEQAIKSETPAQCDGKGWLKNPKNPTGFISCRGCGACAVPREVAAPVLASVPSAVAVTCEKCGTQLVPTNSSKLKNGTTLRHIGCPAEATPAPPAPPAPVKPGKERCSSIGAVQSLTDAEVKGRRTLCPGCGQKLKIADKDFAPDFKSMKIPKHVMGPKKEEPPAPVIAVPEVVAGVIETAADVAAAQYAFGPEDFGGDEYGPIEDHGPSPHEYLSELGASDETLDRHVRSEPITSSVAKSEPCTEKPDESRSPFLGAEYRAPDALLGQQQLVRVGHTLEEVEAAGGYSVVLADPPWSYVQGGRGSTDAHYETMSLDAIKALPVGRLASKDAVLFLWGTWPQLPDVLAVMSAWGFSFKTCAFVWVKHHEGSGKECVGGGFWTRANSEFCLIGVRGKHPKRIDATVRQLIQAPRGKHSAKPAETRDRIFKLMGEIPAIELFARDRDERFDAWGNDPALGGSDVIL